MGLCFRSGDVTEDGNLCKDGIKPVICNILNEKHPKKVLFKWNNDISSGHGSISGGKRHNAKHGKAGHGPSNRPSTGKTVFGVARAGVKSQF